MMEAHSPWEYASFTSDSDRDLSLLPALSSFGLPVMHTPNGLAMCASSMTELGGTPTGIMPCWRKNPWND